MEGAFTLEQFCRALAAHAMLVNRTDADGFFLPELAEETASFIQRFALGEQLTRPPKQKPPEP